MKRLIRIKKAIDTNYDAKISKFFKDLLNILDLDNQKFKISWNLHDFLTQRQSRNRKDFPKFYSYWSLRKWFNLFCRSNNFSSFPGFPDHWAFWKQSDFLLDTGDKLNIHKAFKKTSKTSSERLIYVRVMSYAQM